MSASVVRKADAADDPEDAVRIGDRVPEPLEGYAARTFRGHEAVGVPMERATLSGRREGLEGGEAHVDEQVVGTRDRGREHDVGLARGERVAGKLDCVERARARGVEGKGPICEPEVQSAGGEEGGESGREAVARVDAVGGVSAAPDLFGEVRKAGRGEREIREDETGAGAVARRLTDARERLAGGVEHELEQRVEAVDLGCGQSEARRIEAVLEPAHIAAAKGERPVGGVAGTLGEQTFRIDAPASLGHGAEQVLARDHAVPEFFRAEGPGKGVRLRDDGDGFESVQAWRRN